MPHVNSTVDGLRSFPRGFALYISGPMSGMPEHNFPAFFAWEDKLNDLGFATVNPARLNQEFTNPARAWEFYLRRDLKALLDCEGIFLMADWPKSKGARLEFYVAQQLKMPAFYYDQEFSK